MQRKEVLGMGLFGNDRKEDTLSDKEHIQKTLASIAGGAIGTGAGLASTYPMDASHQNKVLAATPGRMSANKSERETWIDLLRIMRGDANLQDFPEKLQKTYAQALKDNADTLKWMRANPYEAKEYLDGLNKGGVSPLFGDSQKVRSRDLVKQDMKWLGSVAKGDKSDSLSKLFPIRSRHRFSKLVPGATGLAGMALGGQAAMRHFSNEEEKTEN